MDEFGNLDFTRAQAAAEKNSISKNKSFFTRRPTKTRKKKKNYNRKDPIRTTLDHFSYFDADDLGDVNVDNNEVVYGLEYPKDVSYNYREGIRNRPTTTPSDQRQHYQYNTGRKRLIYI